MYIALHVIQLSAEYSDTPHSTPSKRGVSRVHQTFSRRVVVVLFETSRLFLLLEIDGNGCWEGGV